MKRLALVSAALLLAACSSTTIVDDYGFDVDLDFSSQQSPGADLLVPRLTVAGGAGEIVAEGRVATSTPCQRLRGSAEGEGRHVNVTVRIDPLEQPCARTLGGFTYTARAKGLAPGAYVLRVRHDYPGTDEDPPVQEFTVTVR